MAKFKSIYAVNRRIPFVLGEIQGDADGVFEATDEKFVAFLEAVPGFERIDVAPKPAVVEKAPVEQKSPAKPQTPKE